MKDFEDSLTAVKQAIRRKKELKKLIGVLFDEYKLVKAEIRMHKERIEKQMCAKEYSAFLDTIEVDTSLEFPAFSDSERPDQNQ